MDTATFNKMSRKKLYKLIVQLMRISFQLVAAMKELNELLNTLERNRWLKFFSPVQYAQVKEARVLVEKILELIKKHTNGKS